ncbi:MAG: hypothetical protein ACRYGF_05620 [Janthinobacterium lividum]
MKMGTEDRKKLIAAGSFGVLALGYLVYTLVGSGASSDAPAPAPVTVVTTSRPAASSTNQSTATRSNASKLDPTLHPEGMLLTESLVYSGSGRNIFLPAGAVDASAVAVKIPVPLASARFVPATTAPTGPAPLPPIDLRFFGTSTSRDGKRQAFLLRGEDVFIAAPGDIVNRRYRVGAITLTGVEVTDLSNGNSQHLSMSPQ